MNNRGVKIVKCIKKSIISFKLKSRKITTKLAIENLYMWLRVQS